MLAIAQCLNCSGLCIVVSLVVKQQKTNQGGRYSGVNGKSKNHSQDGNRTTLVGWGEGTVVLFPEALLDV